MRGKGVYDGGSGFCFTYVIVCYLRHIGNLAALLQEAGSDTEHVIKTTVFIKDMNDFASVNEVYAKYFTKDFPARSCVEVARLPKDVLIEIEAIALKK